MNDTCSLRHFKRVCIAVVAWVAKKLARLLSRFCAYSWLVIIGAHIFIKSKKVPNSNLSNYCTADCVTALSFLNHSSGLCALKRIVEFTRTKSFETFPIFNFSVAFNKFNKSLSVLASWLLAICSIALTRSEASSCRLLSRTKCCTISEMFSRLQNCSIAWVYWLFVWWVLYVIWFLPAIIFILWCLKQSVIIFIACSWSRLPIALPWKIVSIISKKYGKALVWNNTTVL